MEKSPERRQGMSKETNTGYYNTGNYNTGNYNTGYYNTGYCNTSYYNTGDRNTGLGNTGSGNTGNYNTGYYNTGNYNTGNYNTGYYNTGYYNTGSFHVGCFNTIDAEKVYCFNKLIDKLEWDAAEKPDWLRKPFPATWVPSDNMTDEEKTNNPTYETTGGYLRRNNMKAEWRKAYETATEEEIQMVRDLPAFDYDVFEEITGLDLRAKETAPCEGREVEIDGVVYVLKAKGGKDE